MTLALKEEEFRNFRTTIVHFHSQLLDIRTDESSIVPYLANLPVFKKVHPHRSHRRLLLF